MEENLDGASWDWSIENAIAVIEEARRPWSLKQYIPAEENCPDIADTSQDLQQSESRK